MSDKDIYRQERCASCGQFFYFDTMRRDDAGRHYCNTCFARLVNKKRRYFRSPEITVIGGASLLEILGVLVILCLVAAFIFNIIIPIREKTKGSDLEMLFYYNQDTEIGKLAAEALSIIEREQALDNIIRLIREKPHELNQLEYELAQLRQSGGDISELEKELFTKGQSGDSAIKVDEETLRELEELERLNNLRLKNRKALEKFANLKNTNPEDFKQLEEELKKTLELDSQPQQVGAAIKIIEEWQQEMESQQSSDDTVTTPLPQP